MGSGYILVLLWIPVIAIRVLLARSFSSSVVHRLSSSVVRSLLSSVVHRACRISRVEGIICRIR